MKKGKIIGIAVALAGCAVSIGSAVALYQHGFGGDGTGFGFGGFEYHGSSGAFKFMSSLDNSTGTTGYTKEAGEYALSPTNNSVKFKFNIAASYGTEAAGLVKQDAILGKLSIEKKGDLKDNITVSAYVDGYAKKKNDKNEDVDTYWSGTASEDVRTLGGTGDTISAYIPSPTSSTANMADAVTAGKYVTVHVTVSLNALTDAEFVALNEKSYSLKVTYDDIDAAYGRPYIVGDGTGWGLEDEYAMVPNLAADNYEFCFKGLNSDSAHTFSALKILKNKGGELGKYTENIWDTTKWDIYGAAGNENANTDANITTDPATEYFVTAKSGNSNGYVVNGTNIYQN